MTRAPSRSLVQAIAMAAPESPVDPGRAADQHAAYVAALRGLGVAVTVLPADESLPDGCFVEDQAVVHDGVALIPRVGHPDRRAEAHAVVTALAPHVRIARMEGPGVLDGGDVLACARTLVIGRSLRTDDEGIATARSVFGPLGWSVRAVPVPDGVLHLKSVCSAVDDATVIASRGMPAEAFTGVPRVLWVPEEEAAAANVVAVGRDVLVADGFPATRRVLEGAGYRLHPLAMDEFRKVDGALTCLSVFY